MVLHNQSPTTIKHFHNNMKNTDAYPNTLKNVLNLEDSKTAYGEIKNWTGYKPTNLYSLKNLAIQLGIKDVLYKDEGTRLGLGSFKALGGSFGVLNFLRTKLSSVLDKDISFEDIRLGKYKEQASKYTVVTATDGNHGRSVASGAQQFGCNCQIYIHAEVSSGRQRAMEDLGANVIRVDGNYDESLRLSIKDAAENDWHIISDTSYDGYTLYPRHIMAGYTVLAEEISQQMANNQIPTHIFLQGGVGGLAGAICAHFWEKYSSHNIRYVVVEPDRAPCLIESAKAGKLTSVHVEEETIMAGLSCGEPSIIAWDILREGVDDFVTVKDEIIPDMMRLLAHGVDGDPKIVAGESAVAGLAGLVEAHKNDDIFNQLGLSEDSIVLLIGTEGATDPEIYNSIVNV